MFQINFPKQYHRRIQMALPRQLLDLLVRDSR